MAPAAHTTETPANGDAANGAAISLGVRFTVSGSLDIAAVAFYAPTTNTGTYTAGLWQTTADDDPNGTGTGTLLQSGSLASGSVTAGAWNDIPLASPVTCSTGVVYTAGVHASSGQFVLTTSVFSSASIAGNGVTLLQSGTDPNPPGLGSMLNGSFTEGAALAYPATATGSDYFIDVAIAGDEAVTGELDATLPSLVAAAAGASTSAAVFAAALPDLAAAAAGRGVSTATLAATLPEMAAAAAAAALATGTLSATLPALEVDLSDSVTAAATSTPAVTAAYTSTTAVAAGRTSTTAVTPRRTSNATVG